MQDDRERVLNNDRKRFSVLKAIYTQTNEDEYIPTCFGEVAQAIGVNGTSEREFRKNLVYLEKEGLIKFQGLTNGIFADEATPIYILHKGICEVEAAIRRPEQPTEHFPEQIVNNYHAPVGAIQHGNYNTAEVRQKIGVGESEILNLIKQLESEVNTLPSIDQEAAVASLETLKSEVITPTKPSTIRTVLLALWSIGKDVANFANAVSAIAERLKVHPPHF